MVTFSRMRSIFFTEASLRGVLLKWKTQFPAENRGNPHAVCVKTRNHRIKKTCSNRQGTGRVSNVRWRDESVAMPDTSRGTCKQGRPAKKPGTKECAQKVE